MSCFSHVLCFQNKNFSEKGSPITVEGKIKMAQMVFFMSNVSKCLRTNIPEHESTC